MTRFYCNGKKDYCVRGNDTNIDCRGCKFTDGTGGEVVEDATVNIGSLEFYCNDLDKKISIHDYLIELLKTLWEEQDEFSGKRPFGNSGWDYDLIGCLIANNIIEGKLDEYGYVIEGDTKKGYALIKEYIESLRGGTK